jgi:hypothetical protein
MKRENEIALDLVDFTVLTEELEGQIEPFPDTLADERGTILKMAARLHKDVRDMLPMITALVALNRQVLWVCGILLDREGYTISAQDIQKLADALCKFQGDDWYE